MLSYFVPTKIIACSHIAKEGHAKFGYSYKKMILIYNGVDHEKFQFSNRRADIENYKESPIIGFIGRWPSAKGEP